MKQPPLDTRLLAHATRLARLARLTIRRANGVGFVATDASAPGKPLYLFAVRPYAPDAIEVAVMVAGGSTVDSHMECERALERVREARPGLFSYPIGDGDVIAGHIAASELATDSVGDLYKLLADLHLGAAAFIPDSEGNLPSRNRVQLRVVGGVDGPP